MIFKMLRVSSWVLACVARLEDRPAWDAYEKAPNWGVSPSLPPSLSKSSERMSSAEDKKQKVAGC